MKTVTLFRPIGQAEYDLIAASDWKEFPPRLPDQPIFYPVTNQEYAAQIAERWNTKEPTGVGYVTRFEVEEVYLGQFEKQIVGGRLHEEYWIPAEDLDEFNSKISGRIEVVAEYRADK